MHASSIGFRLNSTRIQTYVLKCSISTSPPRHNTGLSSFGPHTPSILLSTSHQPNFRNRTTSPFLSSPSFLPSQPTNPSSHPLPFPIASPLLIIDLTIGRIDGSSSSSSSDDTDSVFVSAADELDDGTLVVLAAVGEPLHHADYDDDEEGDDAVVWGGVGLLVAVDGWWMGGCMDG